MSLSTSANTSRRHSSVSISEVHKLDIAELEAQPIGYHTRSAAVQQSYNLVGICSNTSLSSESPFRPEHDSMGVYHDPQATSQLDSPEQTPSKHNTGTDTNIPTNTASTQIPTLTTTSLHTLVTTTTTNDPLLPPPIPRR